MKTSESNQPNAVRCCGRCKRVLPLEEFYVNSRTQRPDPYCKDCRRTVNRERHRAKSQESKSQESKSQESKPRRRSPVITQVADRDERLRLIRRALATVEEHHRRRLARLREQEEDLYPF